MSGLDSLADGAGKALKAVPELYEDGLKQTTQETGKTLALIPQAINAAFAPLRIWIANKEYSVEETKKLLALKLEKVNADSIVPPEPYVAVPAAMAISYCQNSEELRDMYANLLAVSMVESIKENAHPSFVEIIKQLTPDEAKLLKKISENGDSYPLIDVEYKLAGGGYITPIHNFTLLAEGVCDNPQNIFSYIDNLERLKLIEIPFGVKLSSDDFYKELESYSEIQDLINSEIPEGCKYEIKRKKFAVTQYGKNFLDTCVRGIK